MKKFFGFCLMVLFSFSGLSALLAEGVAVVDDGNAAISVATDKAAAPAPTKKEFKEFKGKGHGNGQGNKLEQIETSGIIQVTPADPAKKQKYSTIMLVCGEKQYKLIPGRDKVAFSALENMAGQTVTVKGGLMPANEKYPQAAIKVDEIPGVSKAGGEKTSDKTLGKGKGQGKGKAREKQ